MEEDGKNGQKGEAQKMEVEEEKEIKIPTSSANRPVRQRKSVVRLVASIETEPVKEFVIEKGNGSALKDIPNVAYKLSKRKADNTLKVLHTILFGRRTKAAQVKSNISQFSGFVWSENEEKQKMKVKEKLDKCTKEKLVEFCDVLDILTPNKVNTRKEDIVAKLIDFLVAPHATSSELLAEKDQGKKRKQMATPGASTSTSTTSKKRPYKSRKRSEDVSTEREVDDTPATEGKSDDEEKEAADKKHGIEETMNNIPECKVSESASEKNKDESGDKPEDDTIRVKKVSKKSSAKKKIDAKGKEKEVSTPQKSSPVEKVISSKSAPISPTVVVNGNSDITPKTSSKKKTEFTKEKSSSKKKTEITKEKALPPKKPAAKEKPGKKGMKAKAKTEEDELRPSDGALKDAVCEILKEADFTKATFTDIMKLLAERFKMDLTSRKPSIKIMVHDELTRLAAHRDEGEKESSC